MGEQLMSLIAIHDNDRTRFPNYALMKLSAWHKSHGDEVEWFNPLMPYDRVYSSKVFTFTPEDEYLPPDAVRGGTGYGLYGKLPQEVDDIFPDYSLYPDCNYAIGFLTRGCIRKCPWCVVPRKEGGYQPYRDWRDVKRPDSRDLVLMDNNVLASDYGIQQMESMIGQKVRVDFNQGLDSRLITPEVAEIIARLKWISVIRTACDTDGVLDTVVEKIELLKSNGVIPHRVFVYVLVKDIESAERRVLALKKVGAVPFAQPYRDYENNIEPTVEQKRFARWVNRREVFTKTDCFAEYNSHFRRKQEIGRAHV